MKITPINTKIINYKNNTKKTKHAQYQTIALNKQTRNISFSGLSEFYLKMQGLKLQAEAKRNLKQADKISTEAKKIQEKSEHLLLKSQIYQTLSSEILKEIMPAINASRGFGSKINFTDLEDGIISRTSLPLTDGGVQISEIGADGTSRQIFARNGKIFVNECDEKGDVKSVYIFNHYTRELTTFAKNFKGVNGYSIYDEKYEFQNGSLVAFDESSLVNKEETYEKALTRYEFEDGEFIEYVEHLENIEGFKGELGRVFCFSDGKLYEYDEDVKKDFNTDLTSSKKRFIFEPNNMLSFCIVDDKDIDDTWSNFRKLFEYKNRTIQTVDLKVKDDDVTMISQKTFGFKDGKLSYCNFGEKADNNTDTTFSKQIFFSKGQNENKSN